MTRMTVPEAAAKIYALLESMDAEERFRAIKGALSMLGEPVADSGSPIAGLGRHDVAAPDAHSFFGNLDPSKPSGNIHAIAAYWYSQFGTDPFSVEDIRVLADEVGLTVPQRSDMTLSSAQRGGKKLYRRGPSGTYRPTVNGEQFFKDTFKVEKGRKSKPKNDAV